MKKILIILDGLADISNKTALSLSKHPNLDFLAKNSLTGLMWPINGVAPESGEAQFVILGNNVNKYPGRGILEALGIGLKINKKNVYLRINFASLKNKRINNVRASIPSKKLINKLNKINKDIKIIPTIGYRAVMVVKNASSNISNTHPGYIKHHNISNAINVNLSKVNRFCHGDKATCKKINNFILKTEKILKNKTILLRGASNKLLKVKKLRNWSLIGEMPVEIGLAKLLGMKILKRDNEIKQVIDNKNNVYVQIKGPDTYGHVGDLKGKIKAIEKIDKMLKPLIKIKNAIICVTSDHATPWQLKRHSNNAVPILIYPNKHSNARMFTEQECKKGSLRLEGKDLMKFIQKL